MIKIKVMVDDKQLIQQIITTGHAGYADSGYDMSQLNRGVFGSGKVAYKKENLMKGG